VKAVSLANSALRGCNKLRKHAVRSWEKRKANASEEPESAKRRVLQVAKRISNVQQIFGRSDAKPSAVYCI
jgi:hypothetical protein